jgi:hypothetical protein
MKSSWVVPAFAGFILGVLTNELISLHSVLDEEKLYGPTSMKQNVVAMEDAPMPPAVTTATEGDVYTSHVDARVQHFLETAKTTSVPIVTDKVTTHTYQTMYGMFLLPFYSHKPNMKMMEIGLGCDMNYGPGASVALWKKLFPKAELWEAEFNGRCVDSSRAKGQLDGVFTVVGDQGDVPTLNRWVNETHGANFDIVIDDGGHKNTQIKNSFDVLWPKLNRGGLYFIEDLQVQHTPHFDDTGGKAVFQKIINDWTEQLLQHATFRRNKQKGERQQEARERKHAFPLPAHVSFIFCQAEACVIGKAN